ncbi:MAG: hypothetical protein V5A76_08125 [Candidatus Thermoplasmatota archaeon]
MRINVLDGEFVPYLGKAMERDPEIDNMEELLIEAIELWEEEHSQEKEEEADKSENEGGIRDEE